MQKEETVLNIQFVLLDCSHLKFSLVQHCNEWQNKFTTLLKEMAAGRLLDLHNYLKENAEKCVRLVFPWVRACVHVRGCALHRNPVFAGF